LFVDLNTVITPQLGILIGYYSAPLLCIVIATAQQGHRYQESCRAHFLLLQFRG
jgi:hypothetical protein